MKLLLISFVVSLVGTSSIFADDAKNVDNLVRAYFKSKEAGDNRWFGDNLSDSSVLKIKRMFKALSEANMGEDFPDVQALDGGDLYLKLIKLARGVKPNMGKAFTGAKFRLIGTLDDDSDIKYAMYEVTWAHEGSDPISKVSHFKMVRENKVWKIGLLGDIDRAID